MDEGSGGTTPDQASTSSGGGGGVGGSTTSSPAGAVSHAGGTRGVWRGDERTPKRAAHVAGKTITREGGAGTCGASAAARQGGARGQSDAAA